MKFIAATALFVFAVAATDAPPCLMPAVTQVIDELGLSFDAYALCTNDQFIEQLTTAVQAGCPESDFPPAAEAAKEFCLAAGVNISSKIS
ncbi:hypothetical protein NEOLI_005193 [Neolecta irregularis DAH-3]|uniref:CFEM domain-containing protein n=1 Tax=Neolecta irregularis (strain DAH-3) TaxID=1198029 RepID=A0A1U7LQV9_NEOID|nr:hypothetical protein NEOLI_005193 [Neolecta irregularis DAH-3]|eukprot:OLL24901.1 hypothetical protein NEOLI_005193 [Neolecta irregularis DAH-3]